jgi:hypothetical protein
MFVVDEATAEAIRRSLDEGGELSAVVELRRHFPAITDNTEARRCVRIMASWQPARPRGTRIDLPVAANRVGTEQQDAPSPPLAFVLALLAPPRRKRPSARRSLLTRCVAGSPH